MGLLAVGNYVVVKPESKQESTPGGIILPDSVQPENPAKGVVVSVGDGVDIDIAQGDTVYFDGVMSWQVGENVFVRQSDILGVVPQEELDVSDERFRAFVDVNNERKYQDEIWLGDEYPQESWVEYIDLYAHEGDDFRTRMVKVAALAIGAIESYDRKVNETE